jgi:hypothetical protein
MVANSIGLRYPRPSRPRRVDERPKTPQVQLEIAAQWLREAAICATEAKEGDLSLQLSRVAHDCEVVARRAA